MQLTLDTNCLIDLEAGTGEAPAIQQLIELHRAGKIQVHVGAIPASEYLPGRIAPEPFSPLETRLRKLGIHDLPSVVPVGREMAFWGAAVYGAEQDDLVEKIKSVVYSTVDTLTLTAKWRNVVCDVESLAAHIRSGHDVFVTSDQHFRKNTRRQSLLVLGAKDILTPQEALAKVTA
jgi:hypothetical protein